jgi:hypothetical protein
MKKIILLLIAVFTAQIIWSQTDYRKGFLISLNRDTTFGYISYGEGEKNNHFCQFKSSPKENKVTYTPSEIFGYGFINDKFYETRKIENDDKISESVLLEVLVKGLVSLYKYENFFYIDKADTGLVKISNETLESTENGTRMSRSSTKYIGMLNFYLSDCAEIKSKISSINFSERDLTYLIEKYNGYKDVSVKIYKAQKPWIYLKAGVLSGMVISTVKFSSIVADFNYLVAPFDNSKSPIIGISLNLGSPRLTEYFSFQTDVIFYKSNYYSYNIWVDIFRTSNTDYVSIWLNQLKIPFGLRYSFPSGKFKPFMSLGLSTTLLLNSESDWRREVETKSVEPFAAVPRKTIKLYDDKALEMRTLQPGFWGGAGIEKTISKKLSGFIEFRFEKAQGLSTESSRKVLSSSNSSIQFIIGIKTK